MSTLNSPRIDLNPVAFRLTLSFDGPCKPCPATGSIWRHNGKLWLVSNWHVLSGRDIYTGQCMVNCAEPVSATIAVPLPVPNAPSEIVRTKDFVLPLVDDTGKLLWKQHRLGQTIDLACLELANDFPVASNAVLPHRFNNNDIVEIPGIDVFIMGFPRGLFLQGGQPLWKRGSIASEAYRYADGLPLTLVDTASREGMSGSPAFIIQYHGQLVQTATGLGTVYGDKPYRFVGIYSGRYGATTADDELKAQVGRLWWETVVYEMLSDPHDADWTSSPKLVVA